MITIDLETFPIVGNPLIVPPRPVGVAIHAAGVSRYLSWGHPTGNNCTFEKARTALLEAVVLSASPLLFHNAPFDLSVILAHILPEASLPEWQRIHDTQYLLFLADPYASTYRLKPSAERYMGMEAREQAALHDWIVEHVPGATAKNAGAYIAYAPAELVSAYAIGDVVRTRGLFDLLHAQIKEGGMEKAYDRERALFPILFDATRRGVRVAVDSLVDDVQKYERALSSCEDRLRQRLGANCLDNDDAMADALERAGAVEQWVLTPKSGKRSLSHVNLKIEDAALAALMDYRGAITTCVRTFYRPWIALSLVDGRLHPNWNQVRQARGATDLKGARTGRLSSDTPNFQNVPTEWVYADGSQMLVPEGLPPYPAMRRYLLPEEGHVWLKRDFSGQEIRILAHFENGSLLQAYVEKPSLDPHGWSRELIAQMIGLQLRRTMVKITGFSIIYGAGAPGLSRQLRVSEPEAAQIMAAYLGAMPDVRELRRDLTDIGRGRGKIRTWGGRLYGVEPPKMIGGRMRSFEYKLTNYLIQGSAADQTKQCIIDWAASSGLDEALFLATVHDEINISAPIGYAGIAMERLRLVMDADYMSCPMRSEGLVGYNWQDLEEHRDGVDVQLVA